jgi:hypothetical protein
MDLREYHPTLSQINSLIGDGCYQPFIFSDDFISGIGYCWLTGEMIIAMDRATDSAYQWKAPQIPLIPVHGYITTDRWRLFLECNTKLRAMYDSWIDRTIAGLDSQMNYSVIDTAANAGYFLYRFKERGAGNCIGYDLLDFSSAYATLNNLMGSDVRFKDQSYSMATHTIPGCPSADVVISSAIMCHLSDPLNYLTFLGSITKKALLLFTTVDEKDSYQITFDGVKKFYPYAQFPYCFDQNTRITKGLLMFGLKELGFSDITEISNSDSGIRFVADNHLRTFLAIR